MGDLEPWPLQSNGHLPDPNNPEEEEETLLHSYPPNPDPAAIDEVTWQRAEAAAMEVIRHVHPTIASEKRRKAVVEYVNHIITKYIGIVVSPFGSVPLKTYLPDGDIDLTALAEPNSEHSLPEVVWSVLQLEEKNPCSMYEVKDVQLILAEVKLVKCLVQNIVVDISFNQIGGLFTLCFLEEVDVLIGKDHLFKRSIMLIKSWCYYESRILGAHHGLISTYALETLILYIFHLFHKTLDSPLVVLYRFLDYYSKFDWENRGISVLGPISLASLPEIVAEAPEVPASDLLIQEEFVSRCLERYQVKIPNRPNDVRDFCRKNLNIVDPLKPTNNLGRSVSRGNFYRIRSAFIFGARKLSQILSLSPESIPDNISTFFRNTLERHGSEGPRPDVPNPDLDAPIFPQMQQYPPNGLILDHRPSSYGGFPPHSPQFLNGFSGSEPDSSEPGPVSPSIEEISSSEDSDDGFADITGDNEKNIKNLFFAISLFENKQQQQQQTELFMLPGQQQQQPVDFRPDNFRPLFMGSNNNNNNRFGRRGGGGNMYGVVPGTHFAAGTPVGYYFMQPRIVPPPLPSGNYYAGEESPKTRGTGTYLPLSQHQRQQQQQQQQQPYQNRINQRSKPRNNNNNIIRPSDQSINNNNNNTSPELPLSKEEPIFDPPSTSIYRPPHIPYRSPNNNNNQWIPRSPHLGIRANRSGGSSNDNNNNNNGGQLLVAQEPQQVEFGSIGPVVLPTNGLGLGYGLRSPPLPPPPPPVPGVVPPVPDRSKRTNQTYKLKDEGDFPPLSG